MTDNFVPSEAASKLVGTTDQFMAAKSGDPDLGRLSREVDEQIRGFTGLQLKQMSEVNSRVRVYEGLPHCIVEMGINTPNHGVYALFADRDKPGKEKCY